jgi:putative transcriptional regulator
MPLSEKELLERDAKRNIAEELLQSVKEFAAGQGTPVSVSPVVVARMKTGLSQPKFAELLGVSTRTLQEWEQERRKPSRAAKTLIKIAILHPEVLRQINA